MLEILWDILYWSMTIGWLIVSRFCFKNKISSKETLVPFAFILISLLGASYLNIERIMEVVLQ